MVPGFHVSVLAEQLSAAIAPVIDASPDATLVDCDLWSWGASAAILERSRPARVILLDRDPAALEHAKQRLTGATCPLEFRHARFSSLGGILDDHWGSANSRRSSPTSEYPHINSTLASAGSRSAGTRRSTCAWIRRPGRPRRSCWRASTWASWPDVLRRFGEEGEARRIAQAIVAARPHRPGRWPPWSKPRCLAARGVRWASAFIQRRARFRRCGSSSTASSGELDALLEVDRSGCARRSNGGDQLPLARGSTHSVASASWRGRPEFPADLPLTAAELPTAAFRYPAEVSRKGVTADAIDADRNPRSRQRTTASDRTG